MPGSSRREFLLWTTASAVAASLPASVRAGARVTAADRVRLALIGAGGMGVGDTRTALRVPGIELVGVADVYDGRFAEAKKVFGDHLATTRDYRELLGRPDIDAVIIATPDHWHMQQAIDALAAGKHVYLEKPMVRAVDEGHRLIEAQKTSGKVLQVGSQFTSSVVFQKAAELFKAGALGEVNLVEAWWNRNSPLSAWQYPIPDDAAPRNIDWDRFLGSAPRVPFQPIRLFRWRNYRDYGTGVAGDLFVHLFTQLHLVTGSLGPNRIYASGGLRYWKDGRDVADVMTGVYDYPATSAHPAFNLTLKCNFADGETTSLWGESGFRFNGPEGVMTVSPGLLALTKRPAGEPTAMRLASQQRYLPPEGYDDRLEHFRAFFAAVRGGPPVVEDAVYGLRACAPAVLSNVSYFERKQVGWDPAAMRVTSAT